MATDSAFGRFESFLITLISKSGGRVSTRTAADVAGRLAARLFEPVMAQIDPLRLGEVNRAISIARSYGERLSNSADNLKSGALDELINGYPSHGFVIDVEEARKLFKDSDELDPNECTMADMLSRAVRTPLDTPTILDLGEELKPKESENAEGDDKQRATDTGEDVQGQSPHPRADAGDGSRTPGQQPVDREEPAHASASQAVEQLLKSV